MVSIQEYYGIKMKSLFVALLIVSTGCTSIDVRQIDSSHNLKHVCIEKNPKVRVADFVSTIEDAFRDHSITTELYSKEMPEHCEIRLTYTALRSWDITPFLSHAELRLYKGNERIGYAEYHLIGKGGFDLSKWASVKSKITPVVNKLLEHYRKKR